MICITRALTVKLPCSGSATSSSGPKSTEMMLDPLIWVQEGHTFFTLSTWLPVCQ